MKAQIRRLHSPDVADFESHTPERHDDFSILVQVLAGPEGADGEESFDIEVTTPKHIARRIRDTGLVQGRHLLIVDSFDWRAIVQWIERAVSRCDGSTWDEVAVKLSRVGRWEFEDYDA